MAFSKPQGKQDQQDAPFPCSSAADLQEEGEEPGSSNSSGSRQISSGPMLAPGRHHKRESEQDLVHSQCWGKALAGLVLPCELCFVNVFQTSKLWVQQLQRITQICLPIPPLAC